MKNIITKSLLAIGVFAVFGSLAYAHWLILPFGNNVYTKVADTPARAVALVFGGGMDSPGVQTLFQSDRVLAAVELYNADKVDKIIMTGDDGARRANEVDAMYKMAVDAGIPAADIIRDGHGYRTYESCYRAHETYDLQEIIAISQEFHLARIIYLCSRQGIDTIGYRADRHEYGADMIRMQIREALARVKAWWQADISKPLPTSLDTYQQAVPVGS